MRSKSFLVAIVITMALAHCLLAQNTSQLSGTVRDATGGVVLDATVTLKDNATGHEVTKKSDATGSFLFADVYPGTYTVTVELTGFKKASVSGIKLDVGIPAKLKPIVLEVGEVSETVTVSSSAGQSVIQTETTEIQTVVQDQQIKDLPLNGRNAITLAGLQPGIATNTDSVRAGIVHGLRGSFTNLTWNGINIQDNFIRTDSFFALTTPSVDAVSEFSITTSNQGPADGFGAAQVKFTDTRGTKDFHGSAYWFHRNDALDASTYFNNATVDARGNALPKPKLIRNQYGGRVGGPIPVFGLRDRLFFHTDYEGIREVAGTTQLRNVLTDSGRRGLFTYRDRTTGQLRTADLFAIARSAPQRYAPDPRMQGILALTPLPNDLSRGDGVNFAGFRFNSNLRPITHIYGNRIDYEVSSNHKLEGTYRFQRLTEPNDNGPNQIGETFPGVSGGGQKSDRHLGAFAWHWIISPNLTNELRWGFQRSDVAFFTKESFPDGFRLSFAPTSTTTALLQNPIRDFLAQGRAVNNYDLIENLSWNKGKHLFRFGANVRNVKILPFNDAGKIPLFRLGFNTSGNPSPLNAANLPGISQQDLANANLILPILLGSISEVTQTFNAVTRSSGFVPNATNLRDYRYYAFGVYFQDNYRLRPNFKINYGLRWDFTSPLTEKGGLTLFPEADPLLAFPDPQARLNFRGEGTGRALYSKDFKNFAPSIGFAWDPLGNGKTSIRAGYAISYAIDNNVTAANNAAVANRGLQQDILINTIRGGVSTGGIQTIAPPVFQVPRTVADNIRLDPQSAIYAIDPNLRTPYVQQWTLGIQQEIFQDTVVEFRYVGNLALKLARAIDTTDMGVSINNPINVCQNPPTCTTVRRTTFLEDFIRAQSNLSLCDARGASCTTGAAFNPSIPGSQQLFMLSNFGSNGLLNNSAVTDRVRRSEAGDLLGLFAINRAIFFNSVAAARGLTTGNFFTNPNALATDLLTSVSNSTYHGMEAEIRRRWRGGLYLQANYTLSKALADFDGSQSDFQAYLDYSQGRVLEKKRAGQDVRHNFKANWVYELPFGPGKKFLDMGGPIGKFIEGWSTNGIFFWRSGRPFSIVSNRGTKNRTSRSTDKNTVIPGSDVDLSSVGEVSDDSRGRPNLFGNNFRGSDTRASPGIFGNPTAGQNGVLGLTPVSGPNYFQVDLSLAKRTKIHYLGEQGSLDIRLDMFNAFNNTNFNPGEFRNINDTNFGQITAAFPPRILQLSLRLNF